MLPIPVAIVAHPDRTGLVERLAPLVQPEVIIWDDNGIGAGRNHLAAWKWLAEIPYGWGVVLEDDVIPCPNFRQHLTSAIINSPSPILSLYLGRGRPPQAQQMIAQVITRDVSYYTHRGLLSAQGYAMRVELFRSHRAVGRKLRRTCPIDLAISRWARNRKIPISYCRESVVDHLDGPTLIADHGDGQPRNGKTALITTDSCGGEDYPEVRKAWLTAGPKTDWTHGAMPLDRIW